MGYAINALFDKEMDGSVRFHRFRYHLGRGFVEPGDMVLDVGCGTGYGTELLSKVAKNVLGVDMEKANIDVCRDRYGELKNVKFLCTDLEKMSLPRGIDVACAFEVFEHLYFPDTFIKKLVRNVSKWIIFSIPVGQELVWNPETKEHQEAGDSTHKSVFQDGQAILNFFPTNWKVFWTLQLGVTFIAVLYRI